MDENNDDPVSKYLEEHVKRVERIVQSRFNSLMDQLNKLASDNAAMLTRLYAFESRLLNIEKVVRTYSAMNGYLSTDINFVKNELEALENYLAESDAKLRALLQPKVDQNEL